MESILLNSISSTNIEEGRKHAKELGYPFVIKIQVPVGGRGKAGGIQKCQNDDEFELKYPTGHGLDNQRVKKQEQYY